MLELVVPDDEVVEVVDDVDAGELDSDGIGLTFRQTDRTVCRDGVDGLAIREEEDAYCVDYWGYVCGRVRLTETGVEELAENVLGETDLGYWKVKSGTVDADDPPSWLPEDARIE